MRLNVNVSIFLYKKRKKNILKKISSVKGLVSVSFFLHQNTYYTANIYSGNRDTRKKCTLYKHFPYTLQCRSVDITIKHCKSVFTFFHCTWSSNEM